VTDAAIIRFPPRRSVAVLIMRDGGGWLVLAGSHGWIHGDAEAARSDAQWLSQNLALPVREVA
jgi:hypothetical protein